MAWKLRKLRRIKRTVHSKIKNAVWPIKARFRAIRKILGGKITPYKAMTDPFVGPLYYTRTGKLVKGRPR